jgi:acyl-CoA reductase-like NAD-dependent aldehyde dehydrogenase
MIEANAETLTRVESAGSTRLINEVRLRDVVAGADLIRYYAEYADKLEGVITRQGRRPSASWSTSLMGWSAQSSRGTSR